ncbi:MAG: cytochrome c oxidase subunit II [Actinomycetota bacterium]|nr:cytochrome c oxidase subunit II [Actinomycetota bacterium]
MAQESRGGGRRPLMQMAVIAVVASVLGVALGLVIDWFPSQASTQASTIDTLYDVIIIVSVPIFFLVTGVIGFCVWRFRVRPGEEDEDGPPIHGNTGLEIVWTAVPAILLVALCTYAFVALRDIEEAQADEQRIQVIAQQYDWSFEYPNPMGGEPIRTEELYLVEDEPVLFDITALDVIHSFWVPDFRMKRDAVPGLTTQLRVTPNRLGTYPIVCAELCGLGHAFMRQNANVLSRRDFDAWMAEQAEGAGGAGAPASEDEEEGGEAAAQESDG